MGNVQSLGTLDQPVLLHSSRVRTCNKALSPEECDWAGEWWRNWYRADWAYAQAIVYFACAAIAVFTLLHLLQRLRQSRRGGKIADFSGYRSLVALARGLSGRQYRWRGFYSSTSGSIALVVALVIFCAALTLGPRPYYWPRTSVSFAYGKSPPLATRTGWMALACLPFLVLLASKANPITLLTGVSHEKLQVFHRWVSWIMFVLGLVHTFPFIVLAIGEGVMEMRWTMSRQYWTGVLCIIPQAVLMVLSLGPIRNRYYETFKTFHFILAAVFFVTLFLHCDFRLTSWDYFIALGSIYGASLIYRWARATFQNGLSHRARIHVLDPSLLRLEIPTSLQWSPGQHYFFRFLLGEGDLHRFSSHPFTVASVPEDGKMELIVKVRDGITRRLAVEEEVRVLLDGPYGGLQGNLEAFDHVLLVAGGSGGSFILSIFRHLLALKDSSFKSVTVVYSTRSTGPSQSFSRPSPEPSRTLNLPIHISPPPPSIYTSISPAPTPPLPPSRPPRPPRRTRPPLPRPVVLPSLPTSLNQLPKKGLWRWRCADRRGWPTMRGRRSPKCRWGL
ncbi:ferric reductase like transmembrane component-domain-containing protein [Leucosporidium creatinivorum]|uniref:ferric-chelate reductase (NADPH) n=1 Tax=Leucosporidium creatinivorum TaxID=106004 RepID=A0A1Y2G513_9BASI|nr:ferric reductase like transmembrane component-domain-containing protein [Leucosporidium creatinivorum]